VGNSILLDLALKKTDLAIKSKSIIPFNTTLELINQNDCVYELRKLVGKPTSFNKIIGPKPNPFLPWEKELEIETIRNNHVLILNKFPVELGHMLLITKVWKPQNGWLSIKDWEALVDVSKDTSGLWFFNNSPEAGASQPHRHLQLLPRKQSNKLFPRQKWFNDLLFNLNKSNSKLSKSCMVYGLSHQNSPKNLYNAYSNLCKSMKIGDPHKDLKPKCSYNLLITENWIALIRRSQESYKGFSVNGLGFAGYLLVTEISDLGWLKSNSFEDILENVVSPID
tara:strand:- start:990 stop:1832 length:843 start_codon:yes stop_codon:yes gene_type:complete